MSRLLLDEMVTAVIAEQLRDAGHDVIAIVERRELCGLSDADVLTYAMVEGRVVVTLNIRDFVPLERDWNSAVHAQPRTHAGILLVSTRKFPQGGRFVGAMVTALGELLDAGGLPVPGTSAYL